jgi:endonuclease/exonuclease/phosphatase family metal-dependent hydrolase
LYLLAVVLVWCLVRFVGERWWLSAMLTFLPRHVLLVPAVVLAAALWPSGKRLALAYAIVAGAVILAFAGLHISRPVRAPGVPAVRVLSYNVWYDNSTPGILEREIADASPDVVLVQALGPGPTRFLDERFKRAGWHTHADVEFYLASKYPIVEVVEIPRPNMKTRPPFIRYTLDSPIGTIDVFNVHLLSPRAALAAFKGSIRDLGLGRSGNPRAEILANVERRSRQASELADAIRRAAHPVIVAGDTNLPEQSRIFRESFGGLRDGFVDAGFGFGYTYPANRWMPWMRIDRIMCSDEFAIEAFSIGAGRMLDHFAVSAAIARRPAGN